VITEDRLTRALTYLSQTDDECAELKANVARTEYLAKLRESSGFLTAAGNIEERKANAKQDSTVQTYWEEHFKAVAAYEAVRAKRELEALIVDVWRTTSANRRQGSM
jgi:hypothetical protein